MRFTICLLVLVTCGCSTGGKGQTTSDSDGAPAAHDASSMERAPSTDSGRDGAGSPDDDAGSPDGGACGPWLTSCSKSCVDLKRDALHCGACGHGCGAGQVCADGRCSTGYYISPSGLDSNPGTSSAKPWLTFAHAIPLLVPGDTLLLMDGEYTKTTTGLPDVACGPAKNGTESAPITLRSQHERRAHLKSDGSVPGFHMSGCSFWVVEGLYVTSADLGPTEGGHETSVMQFNFVSDLIIRRNLVAHSNRFFNNHGIIVAGEGNTFSSRVLIEDNEVYYSRRWLIAAYHADHIVERRNYTNSTRQYPLLKCQEQGGEQRCTDGTLANPPPCDSSLWCFPPHNAMPGQACAGGATAGWWCVGDPSAHNISADSLGGDFGTGLYSSGTSPGSPHSSVVENNIDEGSCTGMTGGYASQTGTENSVIGNMALGSSTGIWTGHDTLGGLGTIVANNLAVNTDTGLWTNGSLDFSVSNNSSFTAGGNGFFFGQNPAAADGVAVFNNLATNSGNYGMSFNPAPSTCTLEHNNSYAGTMEIPDVCTAANNTTLEPAFLGSGANRCLVYVPGGFANSIDASAGRNPCIGGNCDTGRSNMAGAGKNGADIGANIVFAYQDGVLSRQKLWNPKSGVFLGCDRPGAIVDGINDDAQDSCINVHKRLNVGVNGCPIP